MQFDELRRTVRGLLVPPNSFHYGVNCIHFYSKLDKAAYMRVEHARNITVRERQPCAIQYDDADVQPQSIATYRGFGSSGIY